MLRSGIGGALAYWSPGGLGAQQRAAGGAASTHIPILSNPQRTAFLVPVFHFGLTRTWSISPVQWRVLENARLALLEANLNDSAEVDEARRLFMSLRPLPKFTIRVLEAIPQLLTTGLFGSDSAPLQRLSQANPYFLVTALDGLCTRTSTAEAFDQRVLELLRASGTDVGSLKDGPELVASIDAVTAELWIEQFETLLRRVESTQTCRRDAEALAARAEALFFEGRLHELRRAFDDYYDLVGSDVLFRRVIVSERRHNNFVTRIAAAIRESRRPVCLVGAAHFGGPMGILAGLERVGHTFDLIPA